MEASKLPDTELKTMAIRMLKELSDDTDSIKDMESVKEIQSEMKGTLNEMWNKLQGIKSRVNKAENQIIYLECKEMENSIRTTKRKKIIQK